MAVGLVGVAPGAHPLPSAVAGAGGQVRRVHGDASRGTGGAEEPAEQDDAQHHVPALPLTGPVPHGKGVLLCALDDCQGLRVPCWSLGMRLSCLDLGLSTWRLPNSLELTLYCLFCLLLLLRDNFPNSLGLALYNFTGNLV